MPTLVMSMAHRVMIYLTTVHCKSKKHATCLMHNFGKCLLILKILTVGFCNKFAAKPLLYFPLHLKHVTTLPCKTSDIHI